MILHNDSANCDILECEDLGGAYDTKFELQQDFCTMHLASKFRHVRKLSCWQTNKQTKRRWKHPSHFAILCRWVNINFRGHIDHKLLFQHSHRQTQQLIALHGCYSGEKQ